MQLLIPIKSELIKEGIFDLLFFFFLKWSLLKCCAKETSRTPLQLLLLFLIAQATSEPMELSVKRTH